MKTALTVTLIIMMIVTRIPLVQVSVVAEFVELEVVVPEGRGSNGRGQRQRRAGNRDGGTAPPAGWSNILSAPAVHPYNYTITLFDILEHNTNINAVCKKSPVIADHNDEYATSDKYWRPTNADEIKAFVGINILMGLKQMPEYNDYWSNDPMLNDSYIASCMSKKQI